MSDFLVFLKRFVSHPSQVGSIIPSSRYLSNLMMKHVRWEEVETIVELGPGTGVFTKCILERKKQQSPFFVVERDPEFQQMLRQRFPDLLIQEEAVKLRAYLRELNLPHVDVIVSGLPFAVFPQELREQILTSIYDSLADNGVFITFQYSLQMKQELQERFDHLQVLFTLFNIPPAFVYICKK